MEPYQFSHFAGVDGEIPPGDTRSAERCYQLVDSLKGARLSRNDDRYDTRDLSDFIAVEIDFVSDRDAIELLRQVALHGVLRPPLIRRFEEIVQGRLDNLHPAQLGECVRSLGILHSDNVELFEVLEGKLVRALESSPPGLPVLNDKELAICAIGLGEARRSNQRLIDLVLNTAVERGEEYEKRRVASLLWGICPVASREQMSHAWVLTENLRSYFHGHRDRESTRILQLAGEYHGLSVDFLPEAVHLSDTPKMDGRGLNSFELGVNYALSSIGLNVTPQAVLYGVSTDFLITPKKKNSSVKSLAVFCDGVRYHHLGWRADLPICGTDYVQSEILKGRGFGVARIPDTDWPGGIQDQQQYLIRVLNEALRQ